MVLILADWQAYLLFDYLRQYDLVNASTTWREIYGSRFDLQVFGANLTDEAYRIHDRIQFDCRKGYGDSATFLSRLKFNLSRKCK